MRAALLKRGIVHCHVPVDYKPRTWNEYREFLGRTLVYFNPTRDSPMPRARTEAMFSGCCVLTTPYHGADRFIDSGVNGYIVPREPEYVADLVESLIHEPSRAMELGQRGKETARSLFSWIRFATEWQALLEQIVLLDSAGKTCDV